IPGVTPQPQMASSTTQTTSPATQPEETTPQEQQVPEPQSETPDEEPQADNPAEEPAQEQEQESPDQVSTDRQAPANQPTYGMNGVPVAAANNGYTIVIYSLSRESSAESRRNELSEQGYRVLVATVPSQQYGTLWRVSLGQFRTMRDAALAAEDLESPFSENYFITKIQ
ncbi:MAG: SPOR domain-containing protein, partial [Balneolaceae bacterium]|nr:SPOR domain-containing protein [Balneolaceae bacterium]